MSNLQPSSTRDHLLIPCMPTSNGRMHLGHIAGPYLKLDIIARHLRRKGDHALLLFGSDPHDSFVGFKAYQTRRSEEELTNDYHDQIVRDLLSLDIECDAFINPLDEEWNPLYTSWIRNTAQYLVGRGSTEIRSEKMLYCEATRRFIIGPWLLGECPRCGSDVASYFCEACGFCFRPELVDGPKARVDEGPLQWRDVRCLYLRLKDKSRFFAQAQQAGVSSQLLDLMEAYVRNEGLTMRMTQPGTWGIPMDVPGETVSQVVFSYFGLWAYALALGEVYARMTGTTQNAFHPESGVTTAWSCGIDNSVPFILCGVGAGLEHGEVKPFDHLLINHFYNLHGSKFSTSRGHAIWAGDIVADGMADSDTVRYYIASVNPEFEVKDFDVQQFVAFVNNTLVAEWNTALNSVASHLSLEKTPQPSDTVLQRLDQLLGEQETFLALSALRLSDAASSVQKWISECRTLVPESPRGASDAYWWLKGLALLAYPFMPGFGARLWRALGHEGTPRKACFLEPTLPTGTLNTSPFRELTLAKLSSCLPPTLRGSEL